MRPIEIVRALQLPREGRDKVYMALGGANARSKLFVRTVPGFYTIRGEQQGKKARSGEKSPTRPSKNRRMP
jgi:hypothetical protein